MKKMILMIIALMLAMMPTAAYANEQVEITSPEEIAETEITAEETVAEVITEEAEIVPEEAPVIEPEAEAEIPPVTEEIAAEEEQDITEEISSETPNSSPKQPSPEAYEEENAEETLFIDDASEDPFEIYEDPGLEEEDPIYETARLYVASRAKMGEVDISSFGFKAEEELELSAYLAMSFDEFYIIEENGILVAVVIGEMEDVEEGDEWTEEAATPSDSYSPSADASEISYIPVIEGEEVFEEELHEEGAEISAASTEKEVERSVEQGAEEPLGFFMTLLVIIATVIKNAATLL